MPAKSRPIASARRVFNAPLQVTQGADGTVSVFFPDGQRVTLTADAAAHSAVLLSDAATGQRGRAPARPVRERAVGGGKVIAVNFSQRSLPH